MVFMHLCGKNIRHRLHGKLENHRGRRKTMISRLQKKYALSDQGAKDLLKAIIYSVLANISLMLPVALLAVVLNAMLPVVLGTEEK